MRKAFTLIEVIIVLAVFSVVSLVSVSTFLTTFRVSQQTSIENTLLSDARFIMTQLSAAIQANSIDYEEYFAHCVVKEDCPNQLYAHSTAKPLHWDAIDHSEYGRNYGLYNWQFFYGGEATDGGDSHGIGTRCQESVDTYHEYPNDDCVTGPLAFSEDIDTGHNPNPIDNFSALSADSSAFCNNDQYQLFTWTPGTGIDKQVSNTGCTSDPDGLFNASSAGSYMMEELYLIDPRGEKKTIIASEKVNLNGDKVVAKMELNKGPQATKASTGENMPLFGFVCAPGYTCTHNTTSIGSPGEYTTSSMAIPRRYDPYVYESGENIFNDFVPVSPLRVNVKSLRFFVTPLEDPRRAFAEEDDQPKEQPTVTIFMELEPAQGFRLPFLSDNFNLKLQTTVTSGVIEEVPIVSDSE